MDPKECKRNVDNLQKTRRFKIEKKRSKLNECILNYIRDIEHNFSIPLYKRRKTLESLYSKREIATLMSVGVEVENPLDLELPSKRRFRMSSVSTEYHPSSRRLSMSKPSKYNSCYSKFFKKSVKNARIWEPKPGASSETINLKNKTQILEQILAYTFNQKFESMTPTESDLNCEIIISIFQLLFPFEIAQSLMLKSNLVYTVPDSTCNYYGCFELSNGAVFEQQVQKDINSLKLKPLTVAFNKCLPPELSRGPHRENMRQKWLDYRLKHKDLETFAYVWRDILDLETTKKFFFWMLDRPDLQLPPYFEKVNMFARSNNPPVDYDICSEHDLLEDPTLKKIYDLQINAHTEDVEEIPVDSIASQGSENIYADSYILI